MRDLSRIETCLRGRLAVLAPLGFAELASTLEPDELTGDMLIVPFANAKSSRRLELIFSSGKGSRGPAIATMVYGRQGERVAMHDWLRQHPDIQPLPTLSGGTPDALQRSLDVYCDQLIAVLKGPFLDILRGERWESAPMDWQGLR